MNAIPVVCLAIFIAGCAVTPTASNQSSVDAIQKSCDDPNQTKTMINGHAYFCDDYDHFSKQLQGLVNSLQGGGSL